MYNNVLFTHAMLFRNKILFKLNVKMPTTFVFLTFISMINKTSESLKARNVFILPHFSFYEQLKFRAQLS